MASTEPAANPVPEPTPALEKSAETDKATVEAPGTAKPDKPVEKPADDGLFGAWRGWTGGFNELFSGSREGGPISPRSPSISKAASEIAATAGHAGKAAQKQLGKAAEEIGKGWANLNHFLDEIVSPATDEATRGSAPDVRSSLDGAAELLHVRFPDIDAAEEAVGTYECTLVQKYRCALNGATPEKTFPLAGVLYVTPLHLAMYVLDDAGAFGAPFGVVVPFADVARVQRGQKAMLRIVTKEKSSYVFAGFQSDGEFKAALDLLEHLVGSAETQPRKDGAEPPMVLATGAGASAGASVGASVGASDEAKTS